MLAGCDTIVSEMGGDVDTTEVEDGDGTIEDAVGESVVMTDEFVDGLDVLDDSFARTVDVGREVVVTK
ncbi:unnamed protein product [Aphanomyces euteiches]